MTDLELAAEIAARAHAGQKDRGGRDYITHPQAVAAAVESNVEKIVAILHDVAEDTPFGIDSIRVLFGDEVADAVALLTHEDGVGYLDYVASIRSNSIARTVKLADLAHNMDLTRLPGAPTQADLDRVKKYEEARAILLDRN